MASVTINDQKARAIQVALADRLGLDIRQITNLSVEFGAGASPKASIKWEGVAYLPVDEVRQILESAT